MSRPEKAGLDYFSHDINPAADNRIEYIEAVHGLNGYAIYFKLLEKIYTNGFFIPWSDRELFLLAGKNKIEIDVCKNIINDLINEGLFDNNQFITNKILTSHGIQKRYFKAIERRKIVKIVQEYLLITPELPEKTVIEYIKPVNVHINPVNESSGTQSKVKESKVKERIKTFSSDSLEVGLSQLLFQRILSRNPEHKPPNIQVWAKDIDLMVRVDNRSPDEIRKIIAWSQTDPFWQNNILSTAKLREKYDTLKLKMESNGNGNGTGTFRSGTNPSFGKTQRARDADYGDGEPYPVDLVVTE